MPPTGMSLRHGPKQVTEHNYFLLDKRADGQVYISPHISGKETKAHGRDLPMVASVCTSPGPSSSRTHLFSLTPLLAYTYLGCFLGQRA